MKAKSTSATMNYVLPKAIMFALFFMIAFVTGCQNPLGDVIEKMAGGNVLLSQLGTLANFIAYACMGYPAGKLLETRGYRFTALSAVSVGFIGVFVTFLSGFIADNIIAVVIFLIGALISGFSMCMLNTVVNPMLNSLGKDQNQGNRLVQFGGSFNSMGATLAPIVVGGILGSSKASTISSANPILFFVMGVFAAAFLVLYLSKLPESPDLGKKKEIVKPLEALNYKHFKYGVFAIFCYVGIEVGIANWLLKYLRNSSEVASSNLSIDALTLAGTVVGIYWLLMFVGRLIGGAIGAKVSSRAMLIGTSFGAIVLLLLAIISEETLVPFIGLDGAKFSFAIVQVPMNAIFLVACGLCTSVMWGAIFNLSVQGLGKYTAVASGIFMTMVCGGGVFPALQSIFSPKGMELQGFWVEVVLAAYLLVYALFLSRPSAKEVA